MRHQLQSKLFSAVLRVAAQQAIDNSPRKVDVRLPRTGNSNSYGARPVHRIITMMKWIRTSRLSIKNYSPPYGQQCQSRLFDSCPGNKPKVFNCVTSLLGYPERNVPQSVSRGRREDPRGRSPYQTSEFPSTSESPTELPTHRLRAMVNLGILPRVESLQPSYTGLYPTGGTLHGVVSPEQNYAEAKKQLPL